MALSNMTQHTNHPNLSLCLFYGDKKCGDKKWIRFFLLHWILLLKRISDTSSRLKLDIDVRSLSSADVLSITFSELEF